MKKAAQFKIRLNDELLARLKTAAEANGRSVTEQINVLLDVAAPQREGIIKTQIRLPATLHDKIGFAAQRSGRSINAEMVSRLDSTFL